jgi:hypothetical protein
LGYAVNLTNHLLTGMVGGVGLTGEQKLNGTVRVVNEPVQTVKIIKHEVSSFISGKPAGEADR